MKILKKKKFYGKIPKSFKHNFFFFQNFLLWGYNFLMEDRNLVYIKIEKDSKKLYNCINGIKSNQIYPMVVIFDNGLKTK